ncbi:MAG: glycosyltransferase family 4 protein [Spirochaetaceae bacterium]|nr:glycosyltransferase family 4 protein [Spirochaetaceae bacterium]
MKLAIDCRMMGSGGIGTYLCGLLPYFTEEHQCLLLGRPKDLEEFKGKNGVEILDCSIETFSLKELFCFPSDLLRAINSCDAYYTPYCNIPGRLFGGGITIPIFSTIHDVVFLDIPELAGGIGTMVRKWFYQHAVKKSCGVFTVSQFSAERIRSLLHFPDDKPLVVTYNAVPHWFTESGPQEGNSAEKAAVRSDDLLFVGNIKAHKGLHVLLPAFRLARQKGLQGRLVIVGNANNFRTGDSGILEQFQSLPEEDFSFTGRVSDDELRDLYRRCRLLVQPSLYEGFGMPPLEALSQGTNVVLSDIPVFQEIYEGMPVTFFKAGDVEDLAEKLLSAWQLPPPVLRENRYSFKKTAAIIFDAMERVVARR